MLSTFATGLENLKLGEANDRGRNHPNITLLVLALRWAVPNTIDESTEVALVLRKVLLLFRFGSFPLIRRFIVFLDLENVSQVSHGLREAHKSFIFLLVHKQLELLLHLADVAE